MDIPAPTKIPGARNKERDSFFLGFRLNIARPLWQQGQYWRQFVLSQPVAQICKLTIIDYIQSLDWQILSKDSSKKDELKELIDYYTEGIISDFGVPYDEHVDLLVADLLDLPFGAASELIRENDSPEGKVVRIIPLDGVTLFPTLRDSTPVGQIVPTVAQKPVLFPYYAISRIFMNARGSIDKKGWGMPPPEAIYQTIQMLTRGDIYYQNLLLDTPPPGILDLGDMAEETALKWVDSFRESLSGVEVFKIPVLYEHTTKVDWLEFGKPPTDIQFDKVTTKLAALVCAGYGLTLSDIGYQAVTSGGDTLAGSIRSERKSRRTGYAVVKKKVKAYFDAILPKVLEWKWVDYDDELNVSVGRARLASSTAFGQMIDKKIFTPNEVRRQMMAEGLMTIPLQEEPDESEFYDEETETPERPGMLGAPQSPALGGHGEVTKSTKEEALIYQEIYSKMMISDKATDQKLNSLIRVALESSSEKIKSQFGVYGNRFDDLHEHALYKTSEVSEVIQKSVDLNIEDVEKELEKEDWWKLDDFDEEEIFIAFLAAYNDSLTQNGRELANSVYQMGLIDIPEPFGINFDLQNSSIRKSLKKRAKELHQLLEDATLYFLSRIILSEVRKMLVRDEYAGLDTDNLMRDNVFVGTLVQNIRQRLDFIQEYRSDRSAAFEVGTVQRQAIEDLFRKSGLTLKGWITTSGNPCEVCLFNESQGFVPLDYKYRSQIHGEVLQPLAHPHCKCLLGYSESDLNKQYTEGKFRLWDGK